MAPTARAALDAQRQQNLINQTRVGQYSGPELFFSTTNTYLTPNTIIVPKNINLTRPLESIQIRLRGRVVIAVQPVTTAAAESPVTLLQQVQLSGTHRRWGAQVPIKMSGATIFHWQRLFQAAGNDATYQSGGTGNIVRQADPTTPLAQTVAVFGATGTYDFDLSYNIPLGPAQGVIGRREALAFAYQKIDWEDTLQLQITLGDHTAFGTPNAASTFTWTSYQSASGTPTVEVYLNYGLLGRGAIPERRGMVMRQEQLITNQTALASAPTRLYQLQKQITSNVLVKAGTSLTTSITAGVQLFAALSDTQLAMTQILMDQKAVRNNSANYAMKSYLNRQFATYQPQGYNVFSFIDGGSVMTAYRADAPDYGGSTFEVDTLVNSASASNIQAVTQEMIYSDGLFPRF